MSKFSQAVKKMNKAEPKRMKFDYKASDSPRITQLKQNMADLVERIKKEGIQ